jgi:hypothetical protein
MRTPPATKARAKGTACARSLSTITGITGASCITCNAVKGVGVVGMWRAAIQKELKNKLKIMREIAG